MKKIGHIVGGQSFLDDGLRGHLRDLSTAGYQVNVITQSFQTDFERDLPNVRHFQMHYSRTPAPFNIIFALIELFILIKRERIDLIHTHSLRLGLLAHLAAKMAGTHSGLCAVHSYSSISNTSKRIRWIRRAAERLISLCAMRVYVKSREEMQTALRERIGAANKLRYLGDGIDLQHFNPAKIDPCLTQKKRHALGLSQNTLVIGFIGAATIENGILDLLEAAQVVLRKVSTAQFLIVGSFQEENSPQCIDPRQITSELGISHAVIFTGKQHATPETYALFNLFVCPAHHSGLRRTLMEACAMELPCIATHVSGNQELVEQGENGWLFPRGDVHALSADIIRLINDPIKASEMGKRGRELALERFDETSVVTRLRRDYQHLLDPLNPYNKTARFAGMPQ